MPDEALEAEVSCAFCGEGVKPTEQDPIALGIVEQWEPSEEQPDWTVYAHRECFLERLQPELREPFPPSWWPTGDEI